MLAPTKLITGLDYRWVASNPTYKSGDYGLTVAIAGPVGIPVQSLPQDDGTWLCEIAGTDVTDVGTYYWNARVTDVDNDWRLIGSGTLVVIPNFEDVDTPYDGRSQAQKILDNVRAAIAALTQGKPVQSYSIEGRSASYYSLSELVALEDRYQRIVNNELAAEAIAQGNPSGRWIRTRFN